MDKIGNYNTYTISDSEDSVIMIDDHRINGSLRNDDQLLSSPEPEFFREVIQRQQTKKLMSQKITVHETDTYLVPEDVYNDDNRNTCLQIEDREPQKRKKSLSPELTLNKKNKICFAPEVVYSHENRSDCFLIEESEPSISKSIEPKRKKRLTKEEVEERKKEEKARKDAKKNLAEELKRLNPKECIKNRDFSEQVLTEIRSSDANYKIEPNSAISHSITWSRQMSDNVRKNENCMLIIWDFDYVKNLVTSDQLIKEINRLKLYQAQFSIIIYSTADQLKETKSKKKGQFSMSNMLNSLGRMMLSCHVSFRFVENKNDIGTTIMYFTKAIAQKPYKLNKYKEEQDGCDWYASGYTKNCVTVDKNGNGLTQLWRQMLSQFPLCALETSEAIASVYATPTALYKAYDKCCSRLEGETLLQDIPVRRGFGPLVSNRRIGPELSKKIYTFFTDNTGCTTLSQE